MAGIVSPGGRPPDAEKSVIFPVRLKPSKLARWKAHAEKRGIPLGRLIQERMDALDKPEKKVKRAP